METAQAVGLQSHVMIRILFFLKTKFEAIIASLLRVKTRKNCANNKYFMRNQCLGF